jgi:ParB family chromosome partitioning protein
MLPFDPKGILDYGCGIGSNIPYLRHYFPHAKLYGCDISNESVRLANGQNIQYVHVDYTNNVTESMIDSLKSEGLFLFDIDFHVVLYPEAPEEPKREDFEDDGYYQIAFDSFKAEYEKYEGEKSDFDDLVARGDYVKYLQIKRNRVKVGFFEVEQQEEQPYQGERIITDTQVPQETTTTAIPTAIVNHSAEIRRLKQQDERNREIMVEHITEDAKDLIRTTGNYSGELSDLEIKMMYYFMIPSMTREREKQLIPEKDFASPADRMKAVENLTEEMKALIVREYIRVKFYETYLGSVIHSGNAVIDNFLAFVHQHCPDQLAEITKKYTDVYEKRKKRIDDQLAELIPAPSFPDKVTEQATDEEPSDILPVDDIQISKVA